MKSALSNTLYLAAILIGCWALVLGLTWAPCYSQVCPERYHPLGTRMHIVAYYGLLTSILLALLFRASSIKCRNFSQHHLTRRELPIFRKRISIGGLIFTLWVLGVILATTAYWSNFLSRYWTARLTPTGWAEQIPTLVVTGIFAHYADILLGLLLIPVGRNSILGRALELHQQTLLYAHKLLAYALVLAVLGHSITYYAFVAAWIAVPFIGKTIRKKLAIGLENPNLSLTAGKQIGYYYVVSLFTGTVILALLLVVVISSLPILRRKAYNTFYYMHIILSILILVGTGIHSSTNFYFMLPGLLLWATDWTWRLFRGDTGLVQSIDGTLEVAGAGWMRITLPRSVKKLPPGLSDHVDGEVEEKEQMVAHPFQTYYLNIPAISKLENHAFSAASIGSASTGPVFLFQRTSTEGKTERKKNRIMKKQWTWKVANLMSRADGDEAFGRRTIKIRVEGPYFPPTRDFERADRFICVVGGTGITPALSLTDWFLEHRMPESKGPFTLIWSIRDSSMALLPEWQNLLTHEAVTDGRLRLKTHVSSEYGRLDIDQAIRAELAAEAGQAGHGSVWVFISGPAGLLRAAEDACCDLEMELRIAKKITAPSGFLVDTVSHFAAQWEV